MRARYSKKVLYRIGNVTPVKDCYLCGKCVIPTKMMSFPRRQVSKKTLDFSLRGKDIR
ncbi:hypothetical protein [Candidatus Tisiphia endosymbiont of Hybos culiciformis]|uniref:hypothetical protein n=1 Tax=Candidatus Tisiphia endosymbiont of Hybos culiciformis TaxID=3139331 RepID=UPI003CCA8851